MVMSMTGFGRAETEVEGRRFTVEVKSVNSRFLEVKVRLPRRWQAWEEKIRPLVQARVARGRVDVTLTADNNVPETSVRLDRDAARNWYAQLLELKDELGLTEPIRPADVLAGPEVLVVEEGSGDLESLWPGVARAVEEALDNLVQMRRVEGQALAADLTGHLDALAGRLAEAKTRVETNTDMAAERLRERLKKWLDEVEIDPDRLVQEAAIAVDRMDVSEELVRAASHVDQFRQLLAGQGPVGRKLEFLLQELHREVNTLGAKSTDADLSRLVVDVKSDLERMREQIQNVE
jgi:uncharacterized protein (TIGR00255 family)